MEKRLILNRKKIFQVVLSKVLTFRFFAMEIKLVNGFFMKITITTIENCYTLSSREYDLD